MIIIERPPNFTQIREYFPDASKPGVLFAYGDNIYNPSGITIPLALLMHEGVHQQRQHETSPEKWWERYLVDNEFRYHEELLAHVAEFRAQSHGIDRNQRARLLQSTAQRLVAPLYNYIPPRTIVWAMRDLRQELDR